MRPAFLLSLRRPRRHAYCHARISPRPRRGPGGRRRCTNTAPLHPPAGARVAIIEFEDLECPDCARANPLLKQAAEQYKIPWVRHDFPLPQHDWSFQAAVNARWFDTHSKKLGDDYRDAVFAHQDEITVITNGTYDGSKGLPNLHAFTEKFAADHKLALPFVIDPPGEARRRW